MPDAADAPGRALGITTGIWPMTTIAESDDHSGAGTDNGVLWHEPAKAFLVFVIIQAALVIGGVTPVLDGALAEPDAYMRLNRVAHLWESGSWFDAVFPRIGLDGHVQHWTRPMDLLLLTGAAIAAPFVGFEAGLHWWGVLIAPALQLPAVLGLVWAAAPIMRRDWLWLVGILFVVQPGALLTFLAGRPDQNCLLILFFVLTLGLGIRMLLQPDRLRLAAMGGLVAAMALWVSVESMLFVVVAIAVPGLYWLLGDRRLAKALVVHAGALLASLLAALLLERGFERFSSVEFDMISIAHLELFALNLVFWGTAMLLPERIWPAAGVRGRAAIASIGALAVFGSLWLIQPGFFHSPFATVDDLYRNLRLVNIDEFQPVVRWATMGWSDAPAAIGKVLLWLGAVLVAVPSLVWMIATRPPAERRSWLLLACMAAVFVPLTLLQIRWVAYAEIVMVIPYAAAIGLGLNWIGTWRMPEVWRAVPRALGVSVACVWSFAPAAIASALPAGAERAAISEEAAGTCPLAPLATFLADPDGLGSHSRRVMAFVDFGPELLYRTPHTVYAIPNHRYQPGFTATYRIMTADGSVAAQALLRQNQVELIVVCRNWPVERHFYGGGSSAAAGFYAELASGTASGVVEAVRLPDDLGRHFRIYAVARP